VKNSHMIQGHRICGDLSKVRTIPLRAGLAQCYSAGLQAK
jgi:hypothetical protein